MVSRAIRRVLGLPGGKNGSLLMQDQDATAIVVGGGPAGLTAAVTLAAGGIATVLVGKRQAANDNRTTALLAGSITALSTLGVWELCAGQAAPLKVMRIIDDTGRLWRAPETKFDAEEIGLDAFGYNIENRQLVDALERRGSAFGTLRVHDTEAIRVAPNDRDVIVALGGGERLKAALVIGADGRRSPCRDAAGIAFEEQDYPQVALTFCLKHSRPHHDVSTEFHTPSGPFTLVPLPGQRSSLVWVLDPLEANTLVSLDGEELSDEIERASHSILGKIEVEPGRGRFPLRSARASRFAANRIALVGEAAHVIPPIGAQGLNLGLRDAVSIGELAVGAQRAGRDIGGINVLAAYDKLRRGDIGTRSLAVDLLNKSLLSDFLPVQGARGLGLYLLDRVGPLRRALMREGVTPGAGQPALMRGDAL
jgi:2-octaprenyl-6-methoxyphenol hydroxylase